MGNVLSTVFSKPVIAVGLPLLVGSGIGASLRDDVKTWYPTIKKPTWNPPNWVFGPVWTALYLAMGWASYRVATTTTTTPLPLILYTAQLAMNFAYSPLFFGKKDLKLATIDCAALVGTLTATIISFNGVDQTAALALVPYLCWSSFATVLTWKIHELNKPALEEMAAHVGSDTVGVTTPLLDEVEGVASEATAKAANMFLKQGHERQGDAWQDVPASGSP